MLDYLGGPNVIRSLKMEDRGTRGGQSNAMWEGRTPPAIDDFEDGGRDHKPRNEGGS